MSHKQFIVEKKDRNKVIATSLRAIITDKKHIARGDAIEITFKGTKETIDARIIRARPAIVSPSGITITPENKDAKAYNIDHPDGIARTCGYKSWAEMKTDFEEKKKISKKPFSGTLIEWEITSPNKSIFEEKKTIDKDDEKPTKKKSTLARLLSAKDAEGK